MLFFLLHHRLRYKFLICYYRIGRMSIYIWRYCIGVFSWLCVMLQACKTRLYAPRGITDVMCGPE